MREAGRVVARALAAVAAAAVPGVRLRELDDIAATTIREAGATPSFLGYRPAQASVPFDGRDLPVPERGRRARPAHRPAGSGRATCSPWTAGRSSTAGTATPPARCTSATPTEQDVRLRRATEDALAAGIAAARPGATLHDVAVAVDAVARAAGYSQLPDHGGHGIGRAMHEPPFVPNTPTGDARRHRLRAGNTIAIEPMLHAGTSRYRLKNDGWSIVTADGKRAAHVEHTVAVTDDGPVVLTAA